MEQQGWVYISFFLINMQTKSEFLSHIPQMDMSYSLCNTPMHTHPPVTLDEEVPVECLMFATNPKWNT